MNTTKTKQVYYEQPYLTELDCKVIHIEPKGSQYIVQFDQTICFPEGGGQPCDQAEVVGAAGKFQVEQVRTAHDGSILHQGKLNGSLNAGDQVHVVLRWRDRHYNMRVHSAGHLLHDVLMTITPGLIPTKGNHGKKAFLEYSGQLDPAIKTELEAKVNEIMQQDLPIVTRDTTYDEISKECRFVPAGLPRDKQLRLIKIGNFEAMPDGGVQVKSTKEIGTIVVHNISSENNSVVLRYGIKG